LLVPGWKRGQYRNNRLLARKTRQEKHSTNKQAMWRRTTARWSSSSSSAGNYTFKNRKSGGGGTAGKQQSNTIRPPFLPETTASKKALVVGSSGMLGRAIVHELQEKHDMKVLQADVLAPQPSSSSSNSRNSALSFCDLSQSASLADLTVHLATGVSQFLNLERGETLDVVVCAAGGWAGNPPLRSSSSKHETLEQEMAAQAILYAETIDRMRQVNLDPVLATSHLLQAQLLSRNGLYVVMGATAALQPTPDMIGYGIAKSATHYAIQTLAVGKSALHFHIVASDRQLRGVRALGIIAVSKLSPFAAARCVGTTTVDRQRHSLCGVGTNRRSKGANLDRKMLAECMNASLVCLGLQIQQQDPAQLKIGLLTSNAQGGFTVPVTLIHRKKGSPESNTGRHSYGRIGRLRVQG
jgi:NAD(P)-dependent dehydrogenase (short-subunit alcohol dehydrogenase family)